LLCQLVMDALKNNWYSSHKFVGRPTRSSKKAPFLNVHRRLRDGLMQRVLGTSAAIGFQLDLGVKLGVFYYTFLGNSL